jgi:hypothetical protein
MVALIAFLVLAQATPTPSPAAGSGDPLSGWTAAAPVSAFEYRRFVRHETDGSDSIISATRRVCDCQVQPMQNALAQTFSVASHGTAVVTFTDMTLCGQPAEKLVVSGLATPANAVRNAEIVAFRDRGAFFSLSYTFRSASPAPEAESALASLCPPQLI